MKLTAIRRHFSLLLLLIQVFTVSVLAQNLTEDSSTVHKDSIHAVTPEDSILTISELTLRIEEASGTLHDIENNTPTSNSISVLLPDFSTFSATLASLKTTIDEENLASYNLNQLNNLRNKLIRYNTRLERWQHSINERTEDLSLQKRKLVAIVENFSTKNLLLEDTTLVPLFQDRVAQMLQQANRSNESLVASLSQLVQIQNQLAEQKIFLSNQLNDTKDYILDYQLNLLIKDTPPLWEIEQPTETGIFQKLSMHIGSGLHTLLEYLSENKISIYLQLALFALLLYALYSVKNKAISLNEKNKGPKLDKELYVLQHSWSSALLITLLVGPFLYAHPPVILIQVSFVLMLIPLIVIVEGRKNKLELICAMLICMAYTLAYTESIVVGNSFGQRVILLIAALFSICCVLFFMWQAKKNLNHYPPFFLQILMVFVVIFAITILANIIGYASLSSMLNLATNQSLIFGILLFFSYRIVTLLIYIITYSQRVQRSKVIKDNQQSIFDNLKQLASVALTIYWISLTLVSFNLYDITYGYIQDFLLLPRALGSIEFTFWSILVFLFAIWASVAISNLTKYLLEQKFNNSSSVLRSKKSGYILLTRYFILMIGFFLAIAAAGIPVDKITIILGALSVGIGFGLQNIVNNLVSGLILALERPIQVGDVIEVGTFMGIVQDIGIRSSTIKTFDGSEVIVPNANFISGEVTNWTLSDKHYRIEIMVGVAYGTDSQHVINVLKQTLDNHDEIMTIPEPMVLFQGFGDSSLDFRMLFWCKNRDVWVSLRSEIMEAIYKRFNMEKIEIPFPQRDLHIKTDGSATNGHSVVEKKYTNRKKEPPKEVK